MKIFVISDIHGNDDFEPVRGELETADLVLCSGDLTHFESAERGMAIARKLRSYNPHIFFVAGNCDRPEMEKMLADDVLSIHGRTVKFICGGYTYRISGIGGSLHTPAATPNTYSEDDMAGFLGGIDPMTDIIVSHQPPYGTSADVVMKVLHTGSKNLRKFIEDNETVLCLCGHIHESSGISEIGSSVVLNPGSYRTGKYAVVQMNGKKIEDIKLF